MTLDEVMGTLAAQGTEQNRKVYKRHGAAEPLFGVSFADLRVLQKKIKKDHALAQALWATGNYDARLLAAQIADPAQADEVGLDAWVQDLDNYVVADQFAAYVSATPLAKRKLEQWTASPAEWVGQAGWTILAHLAMTDAALPDSFFEPYLEIIEREIHGRKNRVRAAMNSALIAIGIRNPALEEKALAVSARIGKVVVDHGQTACKTPDAAAYIRKSVERKQKRG